MRDGDAHDEPVVDDDEVISVVESDYSDYDQNGHDLVDSDSGSDLDYDPRDEFLFDIGAMHDAENDEFERYHAECERMEGMEAVQRKLGEDEHTVAGSLPANDSDTAVSQLQPDIAALRTLCRGVDGLEDMIQRALAQQQLPEDERSVISELVDKLQGGQPYRGGTIAICEGTSEDDHAMAASQEWVDVEFEVALDSGSTDNVCHTADAPGYVTMPSQGSKRGQNFVIGDGNKLPNQGEFVLNLMTDGDDPSAIASTFQVAKVSRPLMSVGKICDNGMNVIFDDAKARVMSKDGTTVCTFERQNGGLYLAKFRLKSPAPFGRQGS